MLKDAREEQQQLDEIEEAFIKRRMPLDAAQLAVLQARRSKKIQAYKYVQAELDRMYEEGDQLRNGRTTRRSRRPTTCSKRGAISASRYALEVGQAGRKLAETKDLIGANNGASRVSKTRWIRSSLFAGERRHFASPGERTNGYREARIRRGDEPVVRHDGSA
jgi:hypothetical protein